MKIIFPNFLKKKRFWLIATIILIIIIFIIYRFISSKPKFTYVTEAAVRGDLQQTVSATGAVESAHEISLAFKNSGKIVSISVKEGDIVKAGQELARLDLTSASAILKQYQATLDAAKANLEKVKAGSSPEDIKLTQEQLNKAKNDYDNLIKESSDQIKILKDKTIDTLSNAIFTSQTALKTVYNSLINRETTQYLITSDSNLENKIKNNYELLNSEFYSLRTIVDTAKNSEGDQTKILAAADAVRIYLDKLGAFLDDSYALSDKIIVNTNYTQTEKDTIKSTISSQQSLNNTSLTSVQTARANLVNGINSYTSQIQAASNSVAIYQAQLDIKLAGPRGFDISAAQAQVAQAQAQVDKMYADLTDYYIKAPIDGKITKVNFRIGEIPPMGAAVINMLGTEKFEVKADIPESDITKIKIGDKVIIELDAFGSDKLFSGIVTFIDPAQTIIKDVIYYKTTISFDDGSWNDQIKPGMTANITIKSQTKQGVIYIPQRAVRVKETALGEIPKKFVEVMVNGQPQERLVEVGLRGDNGLVEIISGLSEGDQVVTLKKESK